MSKAVQRVLVEMRDAVRQYVPRVGADSGEREEHNSARDRVVRATQDAIDADVRKEGHRVAPSEAADPRPPTDR